MFALASGEGDASRHSSTAATGVGALQRLNMSIGKQTRDHRLHSNVAGGSRRLLASSLENLPSLSLMLLQCVANLPTAHPQKGAEPRAAATTTRYHRWALAGAARVPRAATQAESGCARCRCQVWRRV